MMIGLFGAGNPIIVASFPFLYAQICRGKYHPTESHREVFTTTLFVFFWWSVNKTEICFGVDPIPQFFEPGKNWLEFFQKLTNYLFNSWKRISYENVNILEMANILATICLTKNVQYAYIIYQQMCPQMMLQAGFDIILKAKKVIRKGILHIFLLFVRIVVQFWSSSGKEAWRKSMENLIIFSLGNLNFLSLNL